MAKGLNLKAVFSSDTSGLKKGSKEATESIKAFENESSGALTSLAGALGINVDQFKRISQVGEGAGRILAKSFKTAGSEAGALAGTIGGIAGGVAGLAVGLAVASWKELNAQADYFYANSTQGAIALAGLNAYTDTMKGVIRELNDPEAAAGMTSAWKKRWANIFGYARAQWQIFTKDLVEFNFTKTSEQRSAEAVLQVRKAKEVANQAEDTAKKLKEAQLKWAEVQATTLADMKLQYEEERLKARDVNLSYEERLAHQQRAKEILQEMSDIENQYRGEIIDLTKLYNTYTMTSYEAQLAEYDLERQRKQITASYTSQQKEVLEYQKTLTNEIKKGNEELRKRAENYAFTSVTADLDNMTLDDWMPIDFEGADAEADAFFASLQEGLDKTKNSFSLSHLDVEAARAIDAAKAVAKQINDSFSGIIHNAVSGISDLVGQAIAGTANFGHGLLALLGDLITQLGEVAISAGVGMLAIKEAFETLNPWVAIAAGVALVALGSAISNSVQSLSSNIGAASGGYSIGSGSSSYASTLNRAPSSEPVEVTGRFEIRGDDLVAVIGRNQKRKSYVG